MWVTDRDREDIVDLIMAIRSDDGYPVSRASIDLAFEDGMDHVSVVVSDGDKYRVVCSDGEWVAQEL